MLPRARAPSPVEAKRRGKPVSHASKRIAICLDGTWNNTFTKVKRDDGTEVLKPSNTLKMSRSILPHDANGVSQVTYYDSGVGALGTYAGLSNRIVGFVDSKMGGAFGAGFEANIEHAVTFLVDNYVPGDQVYVFGFSRGASEARGFTNFISWLGGIPTKEDAYFVPLFFRKYLDTGGEADPKSVVTEGKRSRTRKPIVPVEIELLGVWDTVMALGSRFRSGESTSVKERSFHTQDRPPACVKHARHALAVDEARYDFRPEIWTGIHEGQTIEQRWFPGVHSERGRRLRKGRAGEHRVPMDRRGGGEAGPRYGRGVHEAVSPVPPGDALRVQDRDVQGAGGDPVPPRTRGAEARRPSGGGGVRPRQVDLRAHAIRAVPVTTSSIGDTGRRP